MAGARDCMSVARPLPALREVDSFVIECWGDLISRLGGGWPLLAAKCRARGFDEDAALEIWHRAARCEAVSQQWWRDIEEARRNVQSVNG